MRAVIGTGISKSMRACSPAAIAHAPAFRPAGDGQQDLATDTHLADGRKACVTIPPFFRPAIEAACAHMVLTRHLPSCELSA
jgi:hypothetical protein